MENNKSGGNSSLNYKSLIEESHILHNIEKLTDKLDLQTLSSRNILHKRITNTSWTSPQINTAKINGLYNKLTADNVTDLKTHFKKLSTIEASLKPLIDKYKTADELQEGSLGLLYFRGSETYHLNFVPFFLSIWCTAKKYIFPAFQILLPVFVLIAPYMLLKYVFRMPMTMTNYFDIIKQLYLGNASFSLDNMMEFMKSFVQLVGFVITLFQSTIQSYQHAKHLQTVENDIINFGSLLNSYINTYSTLMDLYKRQLNIVLPKTHIPQYNNRLLALWVISHPKYMDVLIEIVGKIELEFALAWSIYDRQFNLPVWCASQKPHLIIDAARELSICDTMKPVSINLRKNPHAILTGPNRGGKSTVLRAILQNIILSHTLGIVNAASIQLTPLHFIHSCLRLEDKPGAASLFEREIEWAVHSLRNDPHAFGFICIDELFHGTNPNDSLIASSIYLKQLWNMPNIISIISTHQFGLLDNNHNISYYCCPASENSDGTLNYAYGLEEGICKLSSVVDILNEKGLITR